MRSTFFRLAGALALLSATQAQAAVTRQSCITPDEVQGLVGYILPALLDRVAGTCAPHVSRGGYMKARLPGLIAELDNGRDAAWPAAKSAFLKFGSPKDAREVEGFSALPDDALRPIVDQAFTEEFAAKIPASSCPDVEEVLQALEPLPAGNTVRVLSVVLTLAARGDKGFPACVRGGEKARGQ